MICSRIRLLDENTHLVIAFTGGNGTADMLRLAAQAGLRVVMAEEMGEPAGNNRATSP